MLMAHPAVLRNLLEEHASLETSHAQEGGPEVRIRMDDVVYTLCVATGTRDIMSALTVARQHVAAASPGGAAGPAATASAPLADAGGPAPDAAVPGGDGAVAVG